MLKHEQCKKRVIKTSDEMIPSFVDMIDDLGMYLAERSFIIAKDIFQIKPL